MSFTVVRVPINDDVFVTLQCAFPVLCKEAERVKLEMPLKGVSIELYLWLTIYDLLSVTYYDLLGLTRTQCHLPGLTVTDYDLLGLTVTQWDSMLLTGARCDLLWFTGTHRDSMWLTVTHWDLLGSVKSSTDSEQWHVACWAVAGPSEGAPVLEECGLMIPRLLAGIEGLI